MSALSKEDVLKLAQLARLEISEDEIEHYREELSTILEYVAKLDSVDIAGLEPTTQVTGLQNVMRADDVVDYGISPRDLLRLAPASQDEHIKVKRMIA